MKRKKTENIFWSSLNFEMCKWLGEFDIVWAHLNSTQRARLILLYITLYKDSKLVTVCFPLIWYWVMFSLLCGEWEMTAFIVWVGSNWIELWCWKWWLDGVGLDSGGLGLATWWVGGLGLAHLWEAALPPSLGWLAASPGCQEEWPPSAARTQAQLAPPAALTPTPPPCHPRPRGVGTGCGLRRAGKSGKIQELWWGGCDKAGKVATARIAKVKFPWLWGLWVWQGSPAGAQLMQQTNTAWGS